MQKIFYISLGIFSGISKIYGPENDVIDILTFSAKFQINLI